MGYFSFAYRGYDPQVAILTRNTFNPLHTLFERLGVAQYIRQTGNPETALANPTKQTRASLTSEALVQSLAA